MIIYRGLLFFLDKNLKDQASYAHFISANHIDLHEIDQLIAKLKDYLFPEKLLKDRVLDVVKKRNGNKSFDEYVVINVQQELQLNQQNR